MIFASFVFLFWFLPAFLAVYFALPERARNVWMLLASLVFYGWWWPPYLVLLLGSTLFDYGMALGMGPVGSGRQRKRWLVWTLISNFGLLGWFKYSNLFADSWNALGVLPLDWTRVLLPIGISFHTFQSMSYVIDVYRGDVRPVRSVLEVLCYVTMFPPLVAGPIVRYRDVQAEMRDRRCTLLQFSDGVFLFAIGFAKKLLIADQVAPLANAAFAQAQPGLLAAWIGVVAYAVQIYFDFSGYSDIAIGLGRMLGFHIPANFRSPYQAHSITEFWRRWHVSLSTWLRDYLYVPLGGNRRGPARTYVNLALTMLLGGLWHGAAWTFVLWGAWQGLWLIVERARGKTAPWGFLPRPLQIACTFVLVLGGWVIFRAASPGEVWAMWAGMAGGNGLGALPDAGPVPVWTASALVAGLGIAFVLPRSELLVARFQPLVMLACLASFLLAVCHLLATRFTPFLYWNF
jgi:alginate O-acetyltransferase complex protein AlgI